MKNDITFLIQLTIYPPVFIVTSITHIVPTSRNRSNKTEIIDEMEKVSTFLDLLYKNINRK